MKYATKNWIDTANYDIKTAEAMFKSKRFIYVVFMCHLAIEKMVKAVISAETEGLPPKSHSLLYLSDKALIKYPEDLKKMAKEFNKNKTKEVLDMTRRTLRWLRRDKRLKA